MRVVFFIEPADPSAMVPELLVDANWDVIPREGETICGYLIDEVDRLFEVKAVRYVVTNLDRSLNHVFVTVKEVEEG